MPWPERNGGATTQLSAGEHLFSGEFLLRGPLPPSGKLSGSNFTDRSVIRYRLEVSVDIPGSLRFNKRKCMDVAVGGYTRPLAMLQRELLATAPRHAFNSVQTFFLQPGKVCLRAVLPRVTFLKGQAVSLELSVTNSSKFAFKSLRTALLSQHVVQAEGKVSRGSRLTRMPSHSLVVEAGQTLQRHMLTVELARPSESSFHMQLGACTFCLQLEIVVDSAFRSNLVMNVPITLLPTRPQGPPRLDPDTTGLPTATAAKQAVAWPHQLAPEKYQFEDGVIYEGGWAGSRPHGFGVKTMANGDTLSGCWDHGMGLDGTYTHAAPLAQFAAGGATFETDASGEAVHLGGALTEQHFD